MTEEQIREKIIGCAFKVHQKLGGGFLEKVYENAMRIELERAGLRVRQQAPINVLYDGEIVGEFAADLLVEEQIIVELKAVRTLVPDHEVQLVNYLTATGVDTGLVLNFGKSVEVRCKFREFRRSK